MVRMAFESHSESLDRSITMKSPTSRGSIQRAASVGLLIATVVIADESVKPHSVSNATSDAERSLRQSLQLDPQNETARIKLAHLLTKRDEFDEAIEVLAPLVRIDPQESRDFLRAEIQLRLGDFENARNICTDALARRESSFGRAQLGRIFLNQRQYSRAAAQFEKALRLGDQNPETHYGLGRALAETNRYFGDIRTVAAPDGVAGRIVEDHYLIERLPNRVNVFRAAPPGCAVYHLQRAIDGGYDSLDLRLCFARLWLHTRHFDRAVQSFAVAEPMVQASDLPRTEKAEFFHDFAQSLIGAERIDDYLERFRQAVFLDPKRFGPKLVKAYQRAGRRYAQRGDVTGYVSCLKSAASELPDSPDIHYDLANALWESGDTSGAIRHWQATLQLRPGHPDRNRMLELMDSLSKSAAP